MGTLSKIERELRCRHEDATACALRVQRETRALVEVLQRHGFVLMMARDADRLVEHLRAVNDGWRQVAEERRYNWQPAMLEREA